MIALPTKDALLEKTFELMREKRMTYAEARAELGRRGAISRAAKKRRRELGRALMERQKLV